jgi:hypothetical protein
MPGDTRGTDLNSWWRNRAAYRQDVTQNVSRLLALQKRLAAAAGNAQPVMPAPIDSVDELTEKTNQLLADLAEAKEQLPKHMAAMESDRASLQAIVNNVRAGASQRVRQEAERAARATHQAANDALLRNQKIKKTMAAGIAAVVLFLVFWY